MKKSVVYKDPWLTIIEQSAIVRGKKVVVHRHLRKDAVVILPLTKDGYFIIEKQFRHGLGQWLTEVPAGLIEKGENPAVTAKRELEEETGFKADKMKFMFKQYESPAVGKMLFHYYFASGLKKGNKKFDDSEMIKVIKIRPQALHKLIKTNKIKDHKTISAYLYYDSFIAKK